MIEMGEYARTLAAFENGERETKSTKAVKSSSKASTAYAEIPSAAGATKIIRADSRNIPLPDSCVDLIVTSPPYWRKRDYGYPEQIGLESTPQEFVANIRAALLEWRRLLKPTGSIFLNMGDTYHNKSLAGIPGRIEAAACDDGWKLRNRIIWAKENGMPEPSKTRLANRHEYILHLTPTSNYYYDIVGYSEEYGNGANPGDVWRINLKRDMSKHLAPFPEEIVERAITLACPKEVCSVCGHLRSRVFQRTAELDEGRPQARRAMELAKEKGLTAAHIAAIQATGISDAGKALRVQTGTGKNAEDVKRLAAEAKEALGGYFREFTFAKKRTVDWTKCSCNVDFRPAVVLDPFCGTGTTLRVASAMGRIAIGVDLAPADISE
ncbi:DNA-methyltransferase [Pseudomonas soli]|uniref:DNA-methyltransferase n=1 Tax=Pseudomonas soli TaxID=1306993 RepID=UPI0028A7A866|nr:DNA methyltransferase [Pseudomonas soli]